MKEVIHIKEYRMPDGVLPQTTHAPLLSGHPKIIK